MSRSRQSPASRNVLGWTWGASIAVHAALVAGGAWVAYRTLHAPAAPAAEVHRAGHDGLIAIELPGVAEGTLEAERPRDPHGDPPVIGGGVTSPRLDQRAPGRGGDVRASMRAINLGDRDDRIYLSPDLVSRLDRDQIARIKSGKGRQSWEDRRSTTHPTELTFLASGKGERQERRTPSPSDPSRGTPLARLAAVSGGDTGARPQTPGDEETQAALGAARAGSTEGSPGVGVVDGRTGVDHRRSADVAFARPSVHTAAVSIPSDVRGKPRDDVDSDQEVASAVQSIVHASTPGGLDGEGRGGAGGGGDPGAGGSIGASSIARPLGSGDSDWFDVNSKDPRLFSYFRRIHQKVDPLWAHAFPKSALLELKQGMVILEVTIAADGTTFVAWPPVRPSGIDEFDRNCYEAVKRAGPFDPLPRELGRTSLKVRMPFDAQNPIVK